MSSFTSATRRNPAESFQTKQEELLHRFSALSPELQQQVIDFIAFLQARYVVQPTARTRRTPLSKEPFVGIWRDRPEMEDSTAWVRKTRLEEMEGIRCLIPF